MGTIRIKVCGMVDPENAEKVARLGVDYLGFIFFERSPRFVGRTDQERFETLPRDVVRVGVFVNETVEVVCRLAREYGLGMLQLHGDEGPEYCREVKEATGLKIMKALQIATAQDFLKSDDYASVCDFMLFDTRTVDYGGSGRKFDWGLLKEYKSSTPFFLSGGITEGDVREICRITDSRFYGVDLNSRFEVAPGLKDVDSLRRFMEGMGRDQGSR